MALHVQQWQRSKMVLALDVRFVSKHPIPFDTILTFDRSFDLYMMNRMNGLSSNIPDTYHYPNGYVSFD